MRFLLELLCEEIPVIEQQRFTKEVPALFDNMLTRARIGHSAPYTHTTPRRLTVICDELDAAQSSLEEEISGPPENISFKDGEPTKAALGFAKKVGLPIEKLHRLEKGGRTYLAAWNREAGKSSAEVLASLLPELVAKIPFRKSMRWADNSYAFSRPLKSILALLDDEEITFSTHGVTSGRELYGHRFHHPDSVELEHAGDYEKVLRDLDVTVKVEKRLALIRQEVASLAEDAQLTLIEDEGLCQEVVLLVEKPTVVIGSFDEAFLEVPREVIISAMRKHQRYFGFEQAGKLAPRFATVLGTRINDPRVALDGNERVLSARLSDARFFWDEDKKTPLESHADHMKTMVYHRKLGTLHEKIERIGAIAGFLCRFTGADEEHTRRAAWLCKMDLETHMVQEFPELQGVMGQKYAEIQGEHQDVALAIAEHYMPKGAGSELPSGPVGVTVALADKLDAIVGGVAAGLKPTGSSDPFALRRAALGMLRILLERRLEAALPELIGFAATVQPLPVDEDEVLAFVMDRLRTLLLEHAPREMVEAVLAAGHQVPVTILDILKVLREMSSSPEFGSLVQIFKRVNILKKAETIPDTVDPEFFTSEVEGALFAAIEEATRNVDRLLPLGEYAQAISHLLPLYTVVDTFFDDKKGVRVMDDDSAVRGNRFALLSSLDALFRRIADFKLLAGLT